MENRERRGVTQRVLMPTENVHSSPTFTRPSAPGRTQRCAGRNARVGAHAGHVGSRGLWFLGSIEERYLTRRDASYATYCRSGPAFFSSASFASKRSTV
jgi:hypothetical protein